MEADNGSKKWLKVKLNLLLVCCISTVVEHFIYHTNVKGFSTATIVGTRRDILARKVDSISC